MKPAILFVCLGNICRSPLAEAALRARVSAMGQDWKINSAGTADWHRGKAPDRRAQATALRHGIDISAYRARQVQVSDFTRFTHIFALDQQNLRDLRALRPVGAGAHLALLLDMVPDMAGEAVADPYYGDDAGFEITWSEVDRAAAAIVAQLARFPT